MIALPSSVALLLMRSIRRVRRICLVRGLAAVGIVWILGVVAVMAVDARFVIFDDRIRWAMSAGIALVVLVTAVFAVARPLARRLDFRKLAQAIDARHPELEERFSTLVELSESDAAKAGFSTALFARVAALAEDDAAEIDLRREFPFFAALVRLGVFLLMLLVLGVGIAVSPNLTGRLFVRAVAPWVDVGNLFSDEIAVKPGDVVALAGSVIRIEAAPVASEADDPSVPRPSYTLRLSRRTGTGWTEETTEPMVNGVYETTADVNEREWRYRVNAGPAVTRYYYVRVSERPEYESFFARVDYPEYTGFAPSVYSNAEVSAIRAIEGSRVRFDLNVTEPGTVADFRIGGRKVFSHTMVSNRTTNWSLELVNRDGFRSSKGRHPLTSYLDQAPTIVIESPASPLPLLPPHAKIHVELTASDDVRVMRPEIRYAINDAEMSVLRDVDEFASAGGNLWRGKADLDLSMFDLADARTVRFDFLARDNRPDAFGGAHVVTSAVINVTLASKEWGLEVADLKEQTKAAAALIEEAKKRMRDAETLTRQLHDELRRAGKVSEATERKNETAAHEASEAQKRLEELRDRFENDERFAPLTKPLEKLANENLKPALEKIESAPFREREERSDEMAKAADELKKAQEQMNDLAQRLNDRAEKVDAFEKAKDLAERQEALARSARQILEEHPDDDAKFEALKRLEEEAMHRADELARTHPAADLAEARRKMETAVRKLEETERPSTIPSPQDAQKQLQELRAAASEEARARQLIRQAASKRNDERAFRAANNLKGVEQRGNEARRLESQAAEAQRLAEDHLERAEATEGVKALQQQASAQERLARAAEHTPEKAAAAKEAQKAAADALAREQKIREGISKGEKTRADLEAFERELNELLRQQAAKRSAEAEVKSQQALDDAREAVGSAEPEDVAALADAALLAKRDEIAAKLAESRLNGDETRANALRDADDALDAVKARDAEETAREERILDLQQSAADALARSDRRRAHELQNEIVKAQARAMEEADGGDEVQDAREEANESQANANEITDGPTDYEWRTDRVVREEAVKAQNAAMERERAAQEESRTARALEKIAAASRSLPPADDLPIPLSPVPSAWPKDQAVAAAIAAAEAMNREVKSQAAALGLGSRKKEPAGGGGGVDAEVDRLAGELKRGDSPDALKRLFIRLGWFKIRGLSGDNPDERDFKDVPREYRDLVRRYFLKLAQENPPPKPDPQ